MHTKAHKLTLGTLIQTIQIPADGLRDGNMGDDEPLDSAQESLQINILPRALHFPCPNPPSS